MRRHALALLMLFVAVLGFVDATYLTIQHFRGAVPPCNIVVGCERVTTSSYAMLFSVPVALLGSLYYLAIILLVIGYLESRQERPLLLAVLLTPVGFIASAWFVYAQVYIIKAICIYCLGSALSSTALFIVGIIAWRTKETWRDRVRLWMRRLVGK